jgi:hypothetical protein
MCTLTFTPNEDGYILGMNRDEQITRGHATSPAVNNNGARRALYPTDVEGGTWMGASDNGIAFALLNWNDVNRLHPRTGTRGDVIPAVIYSTSTRNADRALKRLEFRGILPFRLVGVFPAEKRIVEWRWNQTSLEDEVFNWYQRQWCSSSLSDAHAAMRRGISYARAQHEADVGSVAWLRRLHASHDDEQRPLSTCVHRRDVKTLSYTEFFCTAGTVHCNYLAGSPCLPKTKMESFSLIRL